MALILENKFYALRQICQQYEIEKMYLFGSALTDQFGPQSDIDILISFKDIPFERYTDNFFELHTALEELFGRKVDLVTERSLSNPILTKTIESTRQLLYAA